MGYSRERLVAIAKLCEQAERWDEMTAVMKLVIANNANLNQEERNLLSVAYRSAVGQLRTAYRLISAQEAKEQLRSSTSNQYNDIVEYCSQLHTELLDICRDCLDLLDEKLIPYVSDNVENTVFYNKMKGDYYRYITESADEANRESSSEKAKASYEAAVVVANKLPCTNPIRLGLYLNYSVFFYEICGKKEEACEMAKKAFDDSIAELDCVSEECYKDSTLIMQLLRDNLTLWSADAEEGRD